MKKGFSLVEVMIIFTLLSVMLAATIPLITKKSNPVPSKISHGVYRCINTESGLIEELYSGSRKIKSSKVTSCSFEVPKAATYKVDLYSAGSGGTEYAKVSSIYNDNRKSYYSMSSGLEGDYNPIMVPSENELFNMFNGKYIIRSVYTGDAEDGDNAALSYQSPYYAYCGIDKNSDFENIYNNKINALKELKEKYKKFKATATGITYFSTSGNSEHIEALEDGWKNIKDYTFSYLYSKDSKIRLHAGDADEDSYSYFIEPKVDASGDVIAARKDISVWDYIFCNGDICTELRREKNDYEGILEEIVFYGNNGKTWYRNNIEKINFNPNSNLYDQSKTRLPRLVYIIHMTLYPSIRNNWLSIESNSERLDDAARTARTKVVAKYWHSAQVEEGTRVYEGDHDGTNSSDWTKNLISHMNKNITDSAGHTVRARDAWKGRIVTTVDNTGNNGYAIGVWFRDVVDDYLNYLNEALKLKVDEKIAELDSEITWLTNEKNQAVYLKDNVYANRKDGFKNAYGTNNDTSQNFSYKRFVVNDDVKKQVQTFCRAAFKTYYNAKGYSTTDHSSIPVGFDTVYTAKYGGDRGRGAYSRVKVRIDYNRKKNGFAGNNTSGESKMSQYLKNLVTTDNAEGFYPVYGKQSDPSTLTSSEISDTLTSSEISDTLTPTASVTGKYSYDLTNKSDLFDYYDGGYAIKNKNGDNVIQHVGWHMGRDGNKLATKTLATGGAKKLIYVNEHNINGIGFGYVDVSGYNLNNVYTLFYVPRKWSISDYNEKNYAYLRKEESTNNTPKNGNDTTFNEISGSNYKTDHVSPDKIGNQIKNTDALSEKEPLEQKPQMVIESKLWTKTYKVGTPGKTGKSESFEVTNLGDKCTFSAAAPGKVFRKGLDEAQIENMKNLLTTTIVCKDSDNNVVLNKSVEGQAYTPNTEDSDKTYSWGLSYRNAGSSLTTKPTTAPDQTKWKPTSLWAKIYKKYMTNESKYDLHDKYKVGYAGEGTKLTDKCLTARGQYSSYMQYLITSFYDNKIENKDYQWLNPDGGLDLMVEYARKDIPTNLYFRRDRAQKSYSARSEAVKISGSDKTANEDGVYQGFDCYGVKNEASKDVFNKSTGGIEITSDSKINKAGVMKIQAGKGGGGAVVITW